MKEPVTRSAPLKGLRIGTIFMLIFLALHASSSTVTGMKGIRALVFSGESIREPVRIYDAESATGVWLSLRAGSVLPLDSAVILNGRRCVAISAFIFNDRNQNIPVEELPAGRGDYVYTMYLFSPGVRPIVHAGNRIWTLKASVAQELRALGVAIDDTTRTAGACS
jgi:hypothetical protein